MAETMVEPHTHPSSESAAASGEAGWHVLELGARLLLEYNVRSELIKQRIERVAAHLDIRLVAVVAYREVTLVAAGDRDLHVQAPELRLNAAVTVEVLGILDRLCAGRIRVDEATRRLEAVERTVPRYGRWGLSVMFGLAAAALARLLGADGGAIAVAGVSSGVGVIARQELARRHAALLTQPFAAGLIGAVLGGVIIRLGWTATPALCLIVPSLMLVPGPHLINGVDDLLQNHIQAGICRLGLAATILMAAALGVLGGDWLVLGLTPVSRTEVPPLTLWLDVVMAGVAASGFGAFYNVRWRVLWISILSGMVGHGVRYLCLQAGSSVEIATLCGCLPIGLIGAVAAERQRLPFSAVAFAGAVPMMPGMFIYDGIANAMRLSAANAETDSVLVAAAVAPSLRAAFVVGAIVLGLIVGATAARLASIRRAWRPRG